MYAKSPHSPLHEGSPCLFPANVDAPVYMRVCVFSDFPGVPSESLKHLSKFDQLRVLIINGIPASFLNGPDRQKDTATWIHGLPKTLALLVIRGKLPWHIHTVQAFLD